EPKIYGEQPKVNVHCHSQPLWSCLRELVSASQLDLNASITANGYWKLALGKDLALHAPGTSIKGRIAEGEWGVIVLNYLVNRQMGSVKFRSGVEDAHHALALDLRASVFLDPGVKSCGTGYIEWTEANDTSGCSILPTEPTLIAYAQSDGYLRFLANTTAGKS